MIILAIDPATHLGFCKGEPGQTPQSGTIRLKRHDDPFDTAFFNAAAWLRDEFVLDMPQLVTIEHFLNPAYSSSSQSAILAVGIYAVTTAICGLYGVRVISPTPNEVRNYTCGKASATPSRRPGSAPRTPQEKAASRAATKAMVVQRAKLLKLIPPDCMDDNRADAALLWYHSCCKFAKTPPTELYLFGEAPA